jgi:glucose/arabinose dehydrogenase/mono/diheme cytochrome c family protein
VSKSFIKGGLLSILVFQMLSTFSQAVSARYSKDKSVIAHGQSIFQQKCAVCHNFKQQGIGPNLTGITSLMPAKWISDFIHNSQEMVKKGDKRAVAVFNKYKVPMPPNSDLDASDMNALLSFIDTHKQSPADLAKADKTTAGLGPVKVDPIQPKIMKSNLVLQLEEVMTAPASASEVPKARINQMTVLKGQKERVFLEDLRGKLYQFRHDTLKDVMDISQLRPAFIHTPGHATGFGSYAFHPEYETNGLLYTTHTEKAGSALADFRYHDSIRVALQWVLTEWKIESPLSEAFAGVGRELFRINMPSQTHGMQQILFNPLATRDSADYGLLYIGIGDGGSAEGGYAYLCNSNTKIWSSVLRIDPAGRNSANGKYGIPSINPYANNKVPGAAGEIFARGFRNPNRISWSPDGKMLIADIGLNNIEELNIGFAGADYGWPAREGSFLLNYKGKMNVVYALPAGKSKFINPVVQYDHDEGNAFSAGFVYTGSISRLKDKYIFGDIVGGRVFYVENSSLIPGKQAVIKEFNLVFNNKPSDFLEITKNSKADLRFGVGANNEMYLFTKTDGIIWIIKDCRVK